MENMLVVFGLSSESYLVGCGRRFSWKNFPQSLTEIIQSGGLTMPNTAWIIDQPFRITTICFLSVTRDMENWVAYNRMTAKRYFSPGLEPGIRDQLLGIQSNVKHVSFGDADFGEFVVTRYYSSAWYGRLRSPLLAESKTLQRDRPNFDGHLEAIIIGQGENHIYALTNGFVAYFDDAVDADPDHPLPKIVNEFAGDNSPWRILPDSALCPWDSHYFFLNFQQAGSNIIQRRWNLPAEMGEKVQELRAIMEAERNGGLIAAQNRFALAMMTGQALMHLSR
ncbi:hypothetical protein BD779DRAFT_1531866 [Infundibulicybe gibba]|nr:hypothetical protein BD779DRAFT_1531866 [Infundibulicybe gibba]